MIHKQLVVIVVRVVRLVHRWMVMTQGGRGMSMPPPQPFLYRRCVLLSAPCVKVRVCKGLTQTDPRRVGRVQGWSAYDTETCFPLLLQIRWPPRLFSWRVAAAALVATTATLWGAASLLAWMSAGGRRRTEPPSRAEHEHVPPAPAGYRAT